MMYQEIHGQRESQTAQFPPNSVLTAAFQREGDTLLVPSLSNYDIPVRGAEQLRGRLNCSTCGFKAFGFPGPCVSQVLERRSCYVGGGDETVDWLVFGYLLISTRTQEDHSDDHNGDEYDADDAGE